MRKTRGSGLRESSVRGIANAPASWSAVVLHRSTGTRNYSILLQRFLKLRRKSKPDVPLGFTSPLASIDSCQSARGPAHSMTLARWPRARNLAKRLECARFTAAFVRTISSRTFKDPRPHESGAEARALQTLARSPCTSKLRKLYPGQARFSPHPPRAEGAQPLWGTPDCARVPRLPRDV